MQINTAINLPQPLQQRPERQQQDLQREPSRDVDQPQQRVNEPASPESNQRRVDLSERVREENFQRRLDQQDLSFSNQQALRAFQENSPSIEQQLGVEIVGVDTFA